MPATNKTETPSTSDVSLCAQWLQQGKVIAYPTATVYGIGCLPQLPKALEQTLRIKERDARKGLILIAATQTQLEPYTDKLSTKQWEQIAQPGTAPTTWIVPANPSAPELVTGGRDTVAVRITHWPVTRKLCDAVNSAIISTSANISGEPAVTQVESLSEELKAKLQGILVGKCANSGKPSTIRDLLSGAVVRA